MAYNHTALVEMLLKQEFPTIKINSVTEDNTSITVDTDYEDKKAVADFMLRRWPGVAYAKIKSWDDVLVFSQKK